MKKEKNGISLIGLLIAIVLLIAIIVVFAVIYTYKAGENTNTENKVAVAQSEYNTVTEPTVTKPQPTINTDDEFWYQFLKMENKKSNMVYSPLSIGYALNMLNDGANGNTKAQIEKIISKYRISKYKNIEDILSLANSVYIRDTFKDEIKDSYKNNLVSKYDAEVIIDKFENAKNINTWIENKTFKQIKNMLTDDVVTNPDNVMFLINALAIDMKWINNFDPTDTSGDTFYLDDGTTINATTMRKESSDKNTAYYKDDNITVLSMDLEKYEDYQMEFIAIMPNKDLSGYIEKFKKDDLNTITDKLKLASETKNGLAIQMPRFSFDYSLQLKNDLKTLGITDAFDKNVADFSNMSNKKLWVGDALHKANIEFTEKGVKAAAVTVIYMTCEAIIEEPEKPVEIKIDKPFMFVIREKNSKDIWFVGTVYEPNLWEKDQASYEMR